jgi:hypothetical protein
MQRKVMQKKKPARIAAGSLIANFFDYQPRVLQPTQGMIFQGMIFQGTIFKGAV